MALFDVAIKVAKHEYVVFGEAMHRFHYFQDLGPGRLLFAILEVELVEFRVVIDKVYAYEITTV